mmetsp:Transcript_16037/g.54466  ORF Transcript_16037/g.54466 Transcript_16037/m.54466 type:complete len:277 (-) Transcript_16037:1085-1915(-)
MPSTSWQSTRRPTARSARACCSARATSGWPLTSRTSSRSSRPSFGASPPASSTSCPCSTSCTSPFSSWTAPSGTRRGARPSTGSTGPSTSRSLAAGRSSPGSFEPAPQHLTPTHPTQPLSPRTRPSLRPRPVAPAAAAAACPRTEAWPRSPSRFEHSNTGVRSPAALGSPPPPPPRRCAAHLGRGVAERKPLLVSNHFLLASSTLRPGSTSSRPCTGVNTRDEASPLVAPPLPADTARFLGPCGCEGALRLGGGMRMEPPSFSLSMPRSRPWASSS